MAKCEVNQCYATNCRYNSNHQCIRDTVIIKENGACAYFITPEDWKSKVLRE